MDLDVEGNMGNNFKMNLEHAKLRFADIFKVRTSIKMLQKIKLTV